MLVIYLIQSWEKYLSMQAEWELTCNKCSITRQNSVHYLQYLLEFFQQEHLSTHIFNMFLMSWLPERPEPGLSSVFHWDSRPAYLYTTPLPSHLAVHSPDHSVTVHDKHFFPGPNGPLEEIVYKSHVNVLLRKKVSIICWHTALLRLKASGASFT